MLEGIRNAFRLPDLRRRLLFTFLALVIYRLVAHVPLPNISQDVLKQIARENQLFNFLDMLSGGAMVNFSVMAMGVYPYITATIVFQLLTPLIPSLERLSREGEAGRRKLNRYSYYLTVPLALLQAYGQLATLQAQYQIIDPDKFGFSGAALLPTLATLLTMTGGTMFGVWLGELITELGVGSGLSLIIFGGIVARIPTHLASMLGDVVGLIVFLLLTVAMIVGIVYVQEAQRRIPVQYGKRVLAIRGNRLRVAGGQNTYIPLRVNSAGMIPLIFAQSMLLFPGVVASYFTGSSTEWVRQVATTVYDLFNTTGTFYWVMYFFLVVGFTYFYTDVIFQQQNMAEMLQRQGGFVPGIRPGRRTEEYLMGVLRRITFVGALFLGVVAVLPWVVRGMANTSSLLITSSGLLIVVGVVLDTMKQLEAQLVMRHYEGFIK